MAGACLISSSSTARPYVSQAERPGTLVGVSQRVSYAEAAEILGVHFSAVAKMRRRGELITVRRRGAALDRGEVEALAERRRLEREKRDARQAGRLVAAEAAVRERACWPDTVHDWLRPSEVARLLDVSHTAVIQMLHRGRLPGVALGSRWWVRRDQLELALDARLARWTREP